VNLGVSLPAHGLIDGSKPHAPAGLSVWYDTKGVEPVVKGEETDFAALAPLPKPARPPQSDSLQRHVSRLVYAMPKDTLLDLTGEQGGLSTRHGLMRAHPKLNMKSTLRDAHIYLFPHWIVDFVVKNERLETIGEDVLGWWAKAGWMPGLDEKLHVPEILAEVARKWTDDENSDGMDDLVDSLEENKLDIAREEPPCPPILAYVHPKAPAGSAAPIIRRVDTAALLLNVSLQLAKRPSYEEAGRDASPYAHPKKVAYPEGVKSRTTITQADSLVAEQVIVEEKVAIKESVVGANCTIREGAKITRCVLMDGVEVGKFARLTGCILGRRCRIGQNSNLTDCEVQENLIIEEGSKSCTFFTRRQNLLRGEAMLTKPFTQPRKRAKPSEVHRVSSRWTRRSTQSTATATLHSKALDGRKLVTLPSM